MKKKQTNTKAQMRRYSRQLKRRKTDAEKTFEQILRTLKISYKTQKGFYWGNTGKFFIVDFFIPRPCKLIFEIDGGYHDNQRSYDNYRTERLEKRRLKVCRFSNQEVFENKKLIRRVAYILATNLKVPEKASVKRKSWERKCNSIKKRLAPWIIDF